MRRTPLSTPPLTWSAGGQSAARPVPAANGRAARRAPQGYKCAGRRKVKVVQTPRTQLTPPACSRAEGMLRAPAPRPGEAGAAIQPKPLTSFLIQDILRDSAERRGGHTSSPQPPRQPDPPRHQEPEPERGRGGAGAPEDEWSAQPRAAQEADAHAEGEPGEPAARLRRPGWARVRSQRRGGPACGLHRREVAELRLQGCGAPRRQAKGPHLLLPRVRLGNKN